MLVLVGLFFSCVVLSLAVPFAALRCASLVRSFVRSKSGAGVMLLVGLFFSCVVLSLAVSFAALRCASLVRSFKKWRRSDGHHCFLNLPSKQCLS
jgi:threonine/homoserine/homoserine lactone efflux protein